MHRAFRLLPSAVILGAFLGSALYGAIPHPPQFNHFADLRTVLGIPNALDVLSNLPFAMVGLWGLARLWPQRHHAALAPGLPGYLVFLVALVLVAFGSSYYHLLPINERLVWDRLFVAIACAGLLAGVRGDVKPGPNGWLWAGGLTLYAVASVAWWGFTERLGQGDLRPYLVLQGAPLVLVPLWQWIHRAPVADRLAFGAAVLCYVLAKLTEMADHQIYAALGAMSGHTLKHLLAALGAGIVTWRLAQRVDAATVATSADDRASRSCALEEGIDAPFERQY